MKEFLNAILLVFNSTYFKCDNQYFKQIFGMPIGSSLLPILADLIIQDLEKHILSNININISVYYIGI